MTVSELLERFESEGLVSYESASQCRTIVPNEERSVEFDWDAYPHMSELA